MIGKSSKYEVNSVAKGNIPIIGMKSHVFSPQNGQKLNKASASNHCDEQADPHLLKNIYR